jgi:hypothetical protein
MEELINDPKNFKAAEVLFGGNTQRAEMVGKFVAVHADIPVTAADSYHAAA